MTPNRQVSTRNSATFLRENPVFTLGQLARALELPSGRKTALNRVKYLAAQGRVKPLARGLYASVPAGLDAKRFEPDRFLVALALREDAVFSHHAALELLGAGHSVWNQCTAFTLARRGAYRVGSTVFRFLEPPARLVRQNLESIGLRDDRRLGRPLRLTGPERTLVEGFRQPRLVGGLEELVESASGLPSLDLRLLGQVLDAYGQRVLWAAAGWFLERNRSTFFVADEVLDDFERQRPRSPQYIPRSLRGGAMVPRWNLVLPAGLVRGGERDEP